jgi:AcrR family transcriptional regulator
MPRQVDHDQKRRHIAEAVWRLAATRGLEEVTIRQVAAEADVPARQLQYYFGTRDDLLLGALTLLNADAEQEAKTEIAKLGENPTPHDVVRVVLLELLPLDDRRRTRHLVHAAYFVRFLSDPALGALIRDTPPDLERLLATLIPGDRPEEADLLVAAAAGLQAQILLGQRSPENATALIDTQLNRLFNTEPQH